LLNAADDGQACTMVDVNCEVAAFAKVLVVWMGMRDRGRRDEHAGAAIQTGLSSAIVRLGELETPTQLDVTALECQYGGLHRRESFDHLILWSLELFEQCPKISHVRLVANDSDTFVDFFEALYRLKGVIGKQVTLGSTVVPANYGQFGPEVASASQLLDQNPKQVLVICRTIVEQVINSLAKMHLSCHPGTLFSGIQTLYCHRSHQNQPRRVESKPATLRCFIHTKFLDPSKALFNFFIPILK
jgi:hypothetical protein